jgi:hypothetical protein
MKREFFKIMLLVLYKFVKEYRVLFKCLLAFVLCFISIKLLLSHISFDVYNDFTFKYDSNSNESDKLERFFKLHKSLQSNREQNGKQIIIINGNSRGILTGSPKCGYGNRLNSIISSMLIAILMDAQINIKWTNIDKYIRTPISDIFDFNLDEKQGFSNYLSFALNSRWLQAKQPYVAVKDIDLLSLTRLPSNYKRYFLDYADPYFMEICSNSVYYEKILFYQLASRASIEAALGNFSSKSDKHEKLFRVGFEVGGNLFSYFYPRI